MIGGYEFRRRSMNRDQQQAWRREALDMAFRALATSRALSDQIVYKGARVLALRLGTEYRASYDLDVNILLSFAQKYPSRQQQSKILKELIENAIQDYVQASDPVRYELLRVRVVDKPKGSHPLGWDAFEIIVNLRDFQNEGVLGIPNISFDVAAPETLGDVAISPLTVGDREVFAYTLERIAGEKMRAFLSSLGAYRRKVKRPGRAIRVKDIYDIYKILDACPLDGTSFWANAGEEFRLACESRFIDCQGIEAFAEDIDISHATFISDENIPNDVDFNDAWGAVEAIVEFWIKLDVLPFIFPLRIDMEGKT